MCGITGLLDPERRFAPDGLVKAVGRMADTLRHRGPDSSGVWADPGGGGATRTAPPGVKRALGARWACASLRSTTAGSTGSSE